MKVTWDYSNLSNAYLKRADYSKDAINQMLSEIREKSVIKNVCDIGAGTGHLTKELATLGFENILAVEPNDNMRALGEKVTQHFDHVKWIKGQGEKTSAPSSTFDLVTFGSSFNVLDKDQTLVECQRILKNRSWFACMWNHRDLNDPIQQHIENIIKEFIKDYSYGNRREDQTPYLESTHLFQKIYFAEGTTRNTQNIGDAIEAWHSHATLERQAGAKFHLILREIEDYLRSLKQDFIEVPYTTRIWFAQFSR